MSYTPVNWNEENKTQLEAYQIERTDIKVGDY